jgi:hypothetical protein
LRAGGAAGGVVGLQQGENLQEADHYDVR